MYEVELEGIHDLDSEISPIWIRIVRIAYQRHDAFESDVSPNNFEVLLTSSSLAQVNV